MKKKEEFVTEDMIEKIIAALQENCERLPLGKPRTAVLQLLIPFIMNNIERGESARKIVTIINKLCYIVNIEDIEAIVAAQTKDTKQNNPKRKRQTKTSNQNEQEPDKEKTGTENSTSGEIVVSNETVKEDRNDDIRGELRSPGGQNGHHEERYGGNDQHENDSIMHDLGNQQDTAGGTQGQLLPEQVPKNDGTFVVDDDDDRIW